jgi:hypothetical protein
VTRNLFYETSIPLTYLLFPNLMYPSLALPYLPLNDLPHLPYDYTVLVIFTLHGSLAVNGKNSKTPVLHGSQAVYTKPTLSLFHVFPSYVINPLSYQTSVSSIHVARLPVCVIKTFSSVLYGSPCESNPVHFF